ncbi:hypothetical protein [Mycolicibacterium aromaticivorans]|uniref:hypothetical protein n=1 Tax=Mycolicibacterium aromaticivorans TaxID=318425 RepID=UPI0004B26624|nr:hypothetical protein [Mycolicibacterium aromaticivorans]
MSARSAVIVGVLGALGFSQWVSPATAHADDVVTYEVVSDDVHVANIEFESSTGRAAVDGAALPWRTEVPVRSVRGAPPDGSQVRADWRPQSAPGRWVSVRIIYRGNLICQNTLDVGNAACYGITPRIT